MIHRIVSILLLTSLIITLSSSVQAHNSSRDDKIALVAIEIDSQEDISLFEATGLPVYAHLQEHQSKRILLSGTDAVGQVLLSQTGLSFRVLDANMEKASYYLAHASPAHQIQWSDYGQILLDDGANVLMRSTASQAEKLALVGAELSIVTYDPKPLRPIASPLSLPDVTQPSALIQDMVDKVDSSTVYSYTGNLSGSRPVWVGSDWYTITSRNTYSGEPIQKATQWVGEHLSSLGLMVENQQWNETYPPNVIAEWTGLTRPEDIYIIGGHLDDMPSSGLAPGADDNASGSVATLIAADILSQYKWDCTLRFALWTGEEQGLWGSFAYAQRAYNEGENILGYLNLDMISWNTPYSSPDIDLIYNSNMAPTLELAHLFKDVVDAYSLNLVPQLLSELWGGSDHYYFWEYGYSAILAIEDQNDFNPYYHTPYDSQKYQDQSYYTDFIKASLGTFAHMSNCLVPYDVDLSGSEAMSGNPGDTLTYTLTVTNKGSTAMDTFTIDLGPSIYPSSVDMDEIGPLNSGESAEFHVEVDIPKGATPGDVDTMEVTAISQGENSMTDELLLTTTVGGTYGVQLGSDKTNESGPPGSTLSYPLNITNSGSLQDTFLLTYEKVDSDWAVYLAQNSISLAGGESAQTTLNILIPMTAADDEWNRLTLQASSSHDPSQWDEVELTITCQYAQTYLPIIVNLRP